MSALSSCNVVLAGRWTCQLSQRLCGAMGNGKSKISERIGDFSLVLTEFKALGFVTLEAFK